MNVLSASLCVALNSGDYQETQHAIYVLNDHAQTNHGGKESAAEVAARILAKEVEKLQEEAQLHFEWRHDIEGGLRALRFDLTSAAEYARAKHEIAELRNRAKKLETQNKRLRDALAEIEAGSFGWKEEVAQKALDKTT